MKRNARKRPVAPAVAKPVGRRWHALVPWLILAMALVSGIWFAVESTTTRLLTRAANAVERQDFVETERLASIVLQRDPDCVEALFLAGSAAWATGRAKTAATYFAQVPDDGSPDAAAAMFVCAEVSFQSGFATDAERLFRRVVELDPNNVAARRRLLFIFATQGRMWELSQFVLPLLKAGEADVNHLTAIGSSKKLLVADLPFTRQCLAANPEDPLPRLIEAKWAMRDQQMLRARDLLEQICSKHPQVLEAQAALGQTILETGSPDEFVAWHAQLPENADEHPAIWFVRGLWAARSEQPKAAVRCFGEVIRRDPSHAAATSQMSTALAAVGEASLAEVFASRARHLAQMALLVDGEINSEQVFKAVQLLRELGRLWEAAGWCRLALDTDAAWANSTLAQLMVEVAQQDTLTMPTSNLASQLDLTQYTLPRFQISPVAPDPGPDMASQEYPVRFRDVAAQVDLAFEYRNGSVGNNLESLFELNGGGIGVIDYDLDGWPDLYLTQGGPLPRRQAATQHNLHDQIFRNQDGERFVDSSAASQLNNIGYSQGIAVGDFDADGFPDLYIANIGANTLWRNNGDGTFQDQSGPSGTQGNVWTSSCLMADLNGDALLDIYAVNYIGGDALYEACRIDVEPRCAPIAYPAEQDRLYVNRGNGTFTDVTEHSGIVAPDGRGLGIVAADFDGSHRLSLFVANDMSANFFFQNETTSPSDVPTFTERAITRGLAFNREGASQASMGIAAGDANQDGRIDLFVTNYYREANAFYWQLPDGSFREDIASARLQQATFEVLGWGTQFIDADLDGNLDILVTNGHVHDPWKKDQPYHMQPQFFRGDGSGQFEEAAASSLGPYFEARHLGRAMARLDWNRDGREDVCIGHLNAPVALLNNDSVTPAHWLSLTLVGVETSRDAIGTVVEITSGERIIVRQLTAGDGFHCSNERRLIFGLGSTALVDSINVHWPSGRRQTFQDIPTDQELILVEGNPNAWVRH